MLGGADEGRNGILDRGKDGAGILIFGGVEGLDHAVGAVHLLVGVGGFGDTVGIDEASKSGFTEELRSLKDSHTILIDKI